MCGACAPLGVPLRAELLLPMTSERRLSGDDSVRLRRVLGTPMLTLYGLGVTVGAGIYVLVGVTADEAGPYAPIAFLIAALVVAFTAFSYAELSTRYPVSAGEAAYVEAGFNSGWLATFVGLGVAASGTVSASAVAIGAAAYLGDFVNFTEYWLVAAVVVVMGAIALWGISQSVAVAAAITVIEILGLLCVIIWGFFFADHAGIGLGQVLPPMEGAHWAGIGAASVLAFFAFVGFEDMANVAEEVKDPKKTMPRAIFWTLVIATALYFGTTTAVLVAVPLDALSASTAPLSLVFGDAPGLLQQTFGFVAIVATVNGVLIQMIMASRVIYGLADRGHLPRALSWVSRRTRTPVVATLAVTTLVLAMSLALPIEALAERTSQIVLSVFVVVNLSLIALKLRDVSAEDCFRVPLLVPVLGTITSLALIVTSFF